MTACRRRVCGKIDAFAAGMLMFLFNSNKKNVYETDAQNLFTVEIVLLFAVVMDLIM